MAPFGHRLGHRHLVTYYAVFVIDLASRRVHIVGPTPHYERAA